MEEDARSRWESAASHTHVERKKDTSQNYIGNHREAITALTNRVVLLLLVVDRFLNNQPFSSRNYCQLSYNYQCLLLDGAKGRR
jgi:hypothetical protein